MAGNRPRKIEMYEVDDKDKVVELENLPQSSVGAPIPMVLAGEHNLLLAFYFACQSKG